MTSTESFGSSVVTTVLKIIIVKNDSSTAYCLVRILLDRLNSGLLCLPLLLIDLKFFCATVVYLVEMVIVVSNLLS